MDTIRHFDETCRLYLYNLPQLRAYIRELERQVENWKDDCTRQLTNVQFYRSLVVKIGEMYGEEAKTSDDGSIQESVLCLKVPELVRRDRMALKRQSVGTESDQVQGGSFK